MDKLCGGVYGQMQLGEQLKYFFVVNRIRESRQHGAKGNRLVSLWEIPNILHVIIFLDMLARAGNGHAVEHLEEVEIQLLQ